MKMATVGWDIAKQIFQPASAGGDANADYESAEGFGDERRQAMETPIVERAWASAAREVSVYSLGQQTPGRAIGAAGQAESHALA
jgi:hypothetical protein